MHSNLAYFSPIKLSFLGAGKIWWVNNGQIEIFIRKLFHSLHAIHVVESKI